MRKRQWRSFYRPFCKLFFMGVEGYPLDLGGVTAVKVRDKLCQQRQPLLNRTSYGPYTAWKAFLGSPAPKTDKHGVDR